MKSCSVGAETQRHAREQEGGGNSCYRQAFRSAQKGHDGARRTDEKAGRRRDRYEGKFSGRKENSRGSSSREPERRDRRGVPHGAPRANRAPALHASGGEFGVIVLQGADVE